MISLRPAEVDDAAWLAALYGSDDVDPFLGPRSARTREDVLAEIAQAAEDPRRFGRLVIEVDGERAGAVGYHEINERNRIVHVEGLAVHPDFRGRRVADEAARMLQRRLIFDLDYHRIELACYGFNDRAIAHAERAGWVREGVRRRAYLRHGEWQDAVQFALIREDLD